MVTNTLELLLFALSIARIVHIKRISQQKVAAPSYTTVTTRGPTEVSREASYKRQQDEELQPWQELIRGLREYFNESLKPFLLYAPEREQVEQLELKHPDKEFATLFGAE